MIGNSDICIIFVSHTIAMFNLNVILVILIIRFVGMLCYYNFVVVIELVAIYQTFRFCDEFTTKKTVCHFSKKNKYVALCTMIHMLMRNRYHQELHDNSVNSAVDAPFLDLALQRTFAVISATIAIRTIHQRNIKYQINQD